jgi:hypothetical protein
VRPPFFQAVVPANDAGAEVDIAYMGKGLQLQFTVGMKAFSQHPGRGNPSGRERR